MRMLLTCTVLFAATGWIQADDQKDVQGLLDNAIKAAGGAEKLNKLQGATFKAKGKYHPDDVPFTGEWFYQMPDRSRVVIDFDIMGEKTRILSVSNGNKGWTKTGDDDTMDMEGDELDNEVHSNYTSWISSLTPLKNKAFTLTPLGEVKVGEKATLGIRVTHKDHKDVNLFFDKNNYLLLKTETRVKDTEEDREVTEEILYDDYKDVQGTKQPMKININWDGTPQWDFTLTELKLSEKLDDSLFKKP